MALFTDGLINSGGDLQKYESGILNIASTEAIDISAKASLAQDEITTELHLFLKRNLLQDTWFLLRPTVDVDDIVITGPLLRWHAYKTLATIYRDAYNNQLNDRYQGKWNEYEKLAGAAAMSLFEAGVGIVLQPVPKGNVPSLTVIPLGVTGTSYYVRVSWLNTSGQEGCVSDVLQATCGDGSATVVGPADPPPNVSYWNVYAGDSPDNVQLQNASPIPISDTWTLPASGLIGGRLPGTGQSPERWIVDRRVLPRG